MPRLMRDIIEEALSAQPDMAIVDVLESPRALVAAARRTRPEFVVIGVDGPELSPHCAALLADQPRVRVMGIEPRAGEAHLHDLRPHRVSLGEVSPTELIAAIRAAARAPSPLGSAT